MQKFRKPNKFFSGGFNDQRHGDVFAEGSVTGARTLAPLDVQKHILAGLQGAEPFLVGRVGSIEGKLCAQIVLGNGEELTPSIRADAQACAGVFPTDDISLRRFAFEYISAMQQMDVSALFNFAGAAEIAEAFPVAHHCRLTDLSPFPTMTKTPQGTPEDPMVPWTRSLEGKRVLVVHPFEETIRSQHARLRSIQSVADIMPDFELLTLKPPVTFLDTDLSNLVSFTYQLNATRAKVAAIDFDVAIVSGGAYGLPIGAFIKAMGKKAIHMGGAGQLLFGITGERWVNDRRFRNVIGANWVRPEEAASFVGKEKLAGTYW